MSQSRCKRQVVILDCCFSGAFAEGMTAKADDTIDIQTQLGGEGRAVLTSSASTQYSFEQQGSDLSVYTRFIVEGIETGTADTDSDGFIAVDELHDYARKKVQDTAPMMNPKIYAVEEGFRIFLAKAPTADPKVIYRKEVEKFAKRGVISAIGRNVLEVKRGDLGLTPEAAAAIETEALKPFQEYQAKLQRYEQVLAAELQQRSTLPKTAIQELQSLQEALGLRKEDADAIALRLRAIPELQVEEISESVAAIESPVAKGQESAHLPDFQSLLSTAEQSPRRGCSKWFWVTAAIVGLAIVVGAMAQLQLVGSKPGDVGAGMSPEPPIESPQASPSQTAQIWAIVVSSDTTLEKALEQLAIAEQAGLPAMIFKRKEWYVVVVGVGYPSKVEAEQGRDEVLDDVPSWAKNKPFVINPEVWCQQPEEQQGYIQCQN
jgi:hypothetical protein